MPYGATMTLLLQIEAEYRGITTTCNFYWDNELSGRYCLDAWKYSEEEKYSYWKIEGDNFYYMHPKGSWIRADSEDRLLSNDTMTLLKEAAQNKFDEIFFGEDDGSCAKS